MVDFQPRDKFSQYYTTLVTRFYENVKAIEAGDAKSFAFCVLAPDEVEAEARVFSNDFNACYAGSYVATVENEDGLLLIRLASRRSFLKRLLHRLRDLVRGTSHNVAGMPVLDRREQSTIETLANDTSGHNLTGRAR